MFSHIVPLPVKMRKGTDSSFYKAFLLALQANRNTAPEGMGPHPLAPPPSVTSNSSFIPPPTPPYPLKIKDSKGKLVGIDRRDYYTGVLAVYGEALDLAGLYYQRRMLGVFNYPEAFEHEPVLLGKEIDFIDYCIIWAFHKLKLNTYEHTVFRLTHRKGMAVAVSTFCITF